MVIAKRFPRDEKAALDRILNSCTRLTLAEQSLYSFSRGGSEITGPSIRLMEAIAQHWGNLEFGFRELERGIDENGVGYSEVQAYAWDIENNTRRPLQFRVPHWRDKRNGGEKITAERDIYELVANSSDATYTWLFQTGGVSLGSGVRVCLGDGTDTGLYVSSTTIGIHNGAALSTITCSATATRALTIQDTAGNIAVEEIRRLTSDATNSTVTPTDVPNFQFTPIASGVYSFVIDLWVQSAATTTGIRIDVTGPAQATLLGYLVQHQTASRTALVSASGGAGAFPINYQPTDAAVASGNIPLRITGTYTVTGTPSGPIGISLYSEVAASTVTIKANSFAIHKRIA